MAQKILRMEKGNLVLHEIGGKSKVIEKTSEKQKKFFQKVTPLNPFAAQSPFR